MPYRRRLAARAADADPQPRCYWDYNPSQFDRSPLTEAVRERTFDIVRADGTEKPVARALLAELEG